MKQKTATDSFTQCQHTSSSKIATQSRTSAAPANRTPACRDPWCFSSRSAIYIFAFLFTLLQWTTDTSRKTTRTFIARRSVHSARNAWTCYICFVPLRPEQIAALVVRNSCFIQLLSLPTCLLNCMIPSVGKTHALAGGTISESAKLTHCITWAAAWGVAPRRASLLTMVGDIIVKYSIGSVTYSLSKTGKHRSNVQLLTFLTCLTGALCNDSWKSKIHTEAASLKLTVRGKLFFCHIQTTKKNTKDKRKEAVLY